MFFQQFLVQLQNRFNEHTQGEVNDLELLLGEFLYHLGKEFVGQLHVVDTVVTVAAQFFGGEVQSSFTEGVEYFGAFLPDTIALSQSFKRTTNFHAV